MKIGDKVTYLSRWNAEHGIIKSLSDDEHVFVVYHCDGDWDRYDDYTAARTRTSDLVLGWKDTNDAH
jgi:phospholipase C